MAGDGSRLRLRGGGGEIGLGKVFSRSSIQPRGSRRYTALKPGCFGVIYFYFSFLVFVFR